MKAITVAKSVSAATFAAALAACGTASADPSATVTRPAACTQPGAQRTVIRTPQSLKAWAAANGDTVADVLGLTFLCGNNGEFDNYLDRGSLSANMRRGTVLWSLLPGGGA